MFLSRTLGAAAVLLGLAVGSANATLLVSTSNTQTSFVGLNSTARLAQSFIAASTDLDDIYMWVSKGATSTGSIVITLRADTGGGAPSATVLHALGGPIAESALPGTKNILQLFDIQINDLTVGDRYWIEMNSDPSGPAASARWMSRTGLTGSSALTPIAPTTTMRFNSGTTSITSLFQVCASDGIGVESNCSDQGFGQPFLAIDVTLLAIDVTPENAPEPMTIAILGAGLAGLGVLSRRRRQSAKA